MKRVSPVDVPTKLKAAAVDSSVLPAPLRRTAGNDREMFKVCWGVHVDDLVGGGNLAFQKAVQWLRTELESGTWEQSRFRFRGRELCQEYNRKSIKISMSKFVQEMEPQLVAEPARGTKPWRDNGEELMRTQVGPRFGQDPPPSFSAPTLAYTYRQWKRDLRLWQATSLQKNRQGGWLLRQLKDESRTAAEVVIDDVLVQDDGIDLIVEELDRGWEVTQDQDKASKIEKALYEIQRDVKMETTFMSYVARRKLNFQQLENALWTSLPAVIKCYATLRDAKLAESSCDKVVMCTGGSYDYDDVMRALVRLDRPEMRPGTSGQSGKTVPTCFTDREVDASTIVPGSEIWTKPSMDRPHWNENLDALQEDVDFCEDGETTIARDGAIVIPGVFYNTTDGQEAIEENEVPQRYYCKLDQLSNILDTVPSERISMLRRSPDFFGPRRGASDRDRGPRMKRSSIQQLKLRTRCARCRKLGHWARECPEGNRGQRNDERYDRRAMRSGENSEGFTTVAKPTERRLFFSRRFLDIRHSRPWRSPVGHWCSRGLVGKQQLDKWCKLLAEHSLQVEWSQEKPKSASGIGGVTQPIGVVYMPVGLVGCNGIIRFTVVEQDVPPLGIMRTLQASLDLTDDGDTVIFRPFGGESSLRTLQSGHSCRPI